MGAVDDLVLLGAGALAREVLDVVLACNAAGAAYRVVAAYTDLGADEELLASRGVPVRRPVAAARDERAGYVVAVERGADRARLAALVDGAPGLHAAVLVHPAATVGSATVLGPGTVVLAGARISCDVRTGVHCVVNLGATVGHDCVLGDHVTLSPGVHLSGRVEVGDRSSVGSGAVVIPRVKVGADCQVGAGSTIVRDLDDGVSVMPPLSRPLPRPT
jgi:sugar O-acyltransferase (sialic acid O-acetyltransferase NeuD family)